MIIMCTTNITKASYFAHTNSYWIDKIIGLELSEDEKESTIETSNKAQQQAKIFSEQARTLSLKYAIKWSKYNANTIFDKKKTI